jgi:hypothetical protein
MLRRIYDSDQAMYPAPLAFARLQSWVRVCPELALCYAAPPAGAPAMAATATATCAPAATTAEAAAPEAVAGAAIVLPVRDAYWRMLLVGQLKESDIDCAAMLDGRTHAEVGLHIFHLEKFDAWDACCGQEYFGGGDGSGGGGGGKQLRRFADRVEADVREVATNSGWRVNGFSGMSRNYSASREATQV